MGNTVETCRWNVLRSVESEFFHIFLKWIVGRPLANSQGSILFSTLLVIRFFPPILFSFSEVFVFMQLPLLGNNLMFVHGA